MERLQKGKVHLIFGQAGQGKTTLAGNLVQEWEREHGRNVVIIDPEKSWQDPESKEWFYDCYNSVPGEFPCVIRIGSDDQAERVFWDLCKWKNYLLVVDELQKFGDSHYVMGGLNELAFYGRNRDVTFLGITRVPHYINRRFRHNWNAIYSFRFLEPAEIKYLSDLTGQDCRFLRNLGDHDFTTFHN